MGSQSVSAHNKVVKLVLIYLITGDMKLLPIGNGNVVEGNPSGDTRNQQLISVVNDCIQLIYLNFKQPLQISNSDCYDLRSNHNKLELPKANTKKTFGYRG
ncbi:Hypothetical predicted protein, partial [Paramuricea clavata]